MSALSILSNFAQTNYQANVAKNNARIAKENSDRQSEATQEAARRSGNEYAQLKGEQLSAQAGSGLDLLGHTQILTRLQTDAVQGEAAKDIYDEGTSRSRNLLQESANYKGQSHILRMTAYANLIADTSKAIGEAILGVPPGGGTGPQGGITQSPSSPGEVPTSLVGSSTPVRRSSSLFGLYN